MSKRKGRPYNPNREGSLNISIKTSTHKELILIAEALNTSMSALIDSLLILAKKEHLNKMLNDYEQFKEVAEIIETKRFNNQEHTE